MHRGVGIARRGRKLIYTYKEVMSLFAAAHAAARARGPRETVIWPSAATASWSLSSKH